jgi:hypothetical protein
MRKSFREELQSIGEELKVQFQSAQQSCKGIDVTSVIDSVLEQHARRGRIPLPDSDEPDSEYDLPPPPHSEQSGRGSIPRGKTTESRDSSLPGGVVPPPGPPPGGSSSSSSSSDSESDQPKDLGNKISKLIRALRKKDRKNCISKQPEAIFLGKALKMKQPEVFDGDRENYIPGPPPGGSSSSSSSSDSESDQPKDLGNKISKLIRALQKKDRKNCISKQPEAIFLGKALKMKEPEVFDGDRENYIPWMKAIKEYMTVRSINLNNDATRIHWLGSLLKGDACQ